MNEANARGIADILGGEAWQSGGNIWLVLFESPDGRMVAISEDLVCEYEGRDAFYEGRSSREVGLPTRQTGLPDDAGKILTARSG